MSDPRDGKMETGADFGGDRITLAAINAGIGSGKKLVLTLDNLIEARRAGLFNRVELVKRSKRPEWRVTLGDLILATCHRSDELVD